MTDFLTQGLHSGGDSSFGNGLGWGGSSTDDQSFSGSSLSLGLVQTLNGVSSYTGATQADSSVFNPLGYTLDSLAKAVGDTVSVTVSVFNVGLYTLQYVYDGYYNTTVNGVTDKIDVYSLLPTNILPIGYMASPALAVNSTGGSAPSTTRNETLQTNSTATCFLRGSMIATPFGEVTVESLETGDLVETLVDGKRVAQMVTWIGNRRVLVRPSNVHEMAPVRIRANAIRTGAPSRDLLVTSEHCIFIDGKFIPARMLVNGSSIISDTAMTSYEYFHVELAQHAVLIAEGLETESYLDTGNRSNFANRDIAVMTPDFAVNAGHKSWETHAAAPLATDRETVEPIWTALSARAATLGLEAAARGAIDNEPELRLLTSTGVVISPASVDGSTYGFTVPADAGALRLLSRTFRPSDAIGPFVDDRRTLGVFVGKIGLSVDGVHSDVSAHLVDAELAGWHPVEGTARWTSGDALLPVDFSGAKGPASLTIEVVTVGLYRAVVVATRVAA